MEAVCVENPVERAVPIGKNAAQANDGGVGAGPNVRYPLETGRWADAGVPGTLSRASVFPACVTGFAEQMVFIDVCVR